MDIALVTAYSLSDWFYSAWHELARYFNTMNTWQWGVVSASAVVFGFLCLRGPNINR